MHRIVYPDLFFLLQLFLNYEILRWEGRWLRRKPGRYGLLAGACVGSAGICFLAFGSFRVPVKQILIFLLSFLLQKVVFPEVKGREWLLRTVVFWVMSFLFSGLLNFLVENTWMNAFLRSRQVSSQGEEVSLTALSRIAGRVLFLCAAVIAAGRVLCVLEGVRGRPTDRFVPVTLIWSHKERTVTGLVDTGNTLRAPWNGQPVHILSRSAWRDLEQIPASQVRFVPYRSVGRAEGVLPAVTLDGMKVGEDMYLEKPVVAISRDPICRGDRYQMIVSEEGLRE
ncbi:MAG: sigma-E processing peptidase SpoIIGA [Lachnospiraceae bacterium]|nr:sigma-E processing peptidase SpoIIGA [Lachnospiraceae bacterium]